MTTFLGFYCLQPNLSYTYIFSFLRLWPLSFLFWKEKHQRKYNLSQLVVITSSSLNVSKYTSKYMKLTNRVQCQSQNCRHTDLRLYFISFSYIYFIQIGTYAFPFNNRQHIIVFVYSRLLSRKSEDLQLVTRLDKCTLKEYFGSTGFFLLLYLTFLLSVSHKSPQLHRSCHLHALLQN